MDPLVEHPIVAAVGAVRTTLKGVGDANPTFMTTDDKAHALTELVRAGQEPAAGSGCGRSGRAVTGT